MHVEWIEFTRQFQFYIPTQRTPMPVKWTQPQSLSHLSISFAPRKSNRLQFMANKFSLAGVSAFSRPENRGQTHTSAQTKLGGRQKQCVDLSNRPQGHKFVLHSHSDTLLTRRIGSRRSTDPPRAPLDASRRSGDAPAAFHLVHVTREIMQFSSEWVNAGAVAGWMWKKIGAHRRTQILSQAQLLLGCNHCAFGRIWIWTQFSSRSFSTAWCHLCYLLSHLPQRACTYTCGDRRKKVSAGTCFA